MVKLIEKRADKEEIEKVEKRNYAHVSKIFYSI